MSSINPNSEDLKKGKKRARFYQGPAEAEKKFEAEKKQLMIDKLNKENQLKNETIARKNAESKKESTKEIREVVLRRMFRIYTKLCS